MIALADTVITTTASWHTAAPKCLHAYAVSSAGISSVRSALGAAGMCNPHGYCPADFLVNMLTRPAREKTFSITPNIMTQVNSHPCSFGVR